MALHFRARPASARAAGRRLALGSIGRFLLISTVLIIASGSITWARDDKDKDKKDTKRASLVLKATPPIAFSPAKVFVTAELRGGVDTTDELYCPGLEWDWGDGTKSEATTDCEPF